MCGGGVCVVVVMVVVCVVQMTDDTASLSWRVRRMQLITGQSPRESNSRATAPAPTSPDGRYHKTRGTSEQRD